MLRACSTASQPCRPGPGKGSVAPARRAFNRSHKCLCCIVSMYGTEQQGWSHASHELTKMVFETGSSQGQSCDSFSAGCKVKGTLENAMNPYPAVDPIPLPAPVWLLKLLHVVTLSLHFVAVEMLLGGLLLAILLSLFRKSAHSHGDRKGAGAAADGGDDLRDQPGRAAALVRAGALRARALHQQRADRALLDCDHPHADFDLLAALQVFSAA